MGEKRKKNGRKTMNKSLDANINQNDKNERLTAKEKEFCKIFAETFDKRRAAYEAGYKLLPLKNALKLLEKQKVRDYLDCILNNRDGFSGEVEAGLRRLAFGSAADAVKLLFADSLTDEQIESLDLFNVSDIKKPKGGGLEIKFFDRQKALELLADLSSVKTDGALPFYKALEKSVGKAQEDDY